MHSEINNINFLEWLKSKKYNDYWFISDTPDNYALSTYNKNYKPAFKLSIIN